MTGENTSTENPHLQERASREPEVSYSHGLKDRVLVAGAENSSLCITNTVID